MGRLSIVSAIVNLEFTDGSKMEHIELNYSQWQQMYRTGQWEGKKVEVLELEKRHQDKGPDRIRFL